MEDLKRRLELKSSIVKQQTIKKIYDNVLKCKEEISESAPQSAELKLLWEKCGDADVIVSSACCQALLGLLRSNRVKFQYILKGLLNAVPSAKNLNGIIHTVADILILQLLVIHQEQGNYVNPYTIRNPPHPFVTIVTNRSDSSNLLSQQVHRILRCPNKTIKAFSTELLGPFLKFILLEPTMSPQFAHLRLTLPSTCLHAVDAVCGEKSHNGDDKLNEYKIVEFLLSLVPCLQTKTTNALHEAIQYIKSLTIHILKSTTNLEVQKGSQSQEELKKLMKNILLLAGQCIDDGMQVDVLLDLLLDVVETNPQIWVKGALPQLISLLQTCPPSNHGKLLWLVNQFLENVKHKSGDTSHDEYLLLSLLYTPILNILTFSEPLYMDDVAYVRQLAESILVKIQFYSKKPRCVNCQHCDENVESLDISIAIDSYRNDFLVQLCQKLSTVSEPSLHRWLLGLEQSINCSARHTGFISAHIVHLVVGIFCTTDDVGVLNQCLKLLEIIASLDCAQSLSLLPVLLYKMNHISSPSCKLHILETLPKIATHKVSMAPILKSLQLLGGSAELRALSISLITSLWQQQDRCYPYLQQLLTEKEFGSVQCQSELNEVTLAKAASISTICKLRPHQHGEDMVQPISMILNQCSSNEDAPAISLVLEGLYHLCQAEVVDIRTAWTVLAAKLSKDTRPVVIQGICSLFSIVPELTAGNANYDKFVADVLSLLWKYADGEISTDPIVINAAYNALSKFSPDIFSISHLPKKVTKDIIEAALAELPEEFEVDESSLPVITGECYSNLLMSLPVSSIPGFKTFLTSLLRHEMVHMPRGAHHSMNRRETVTGKQDTAVTSIPSVLLELYENNKQPGLRHGLAASLLFGYEPPMQLGRDGKPRKNHIAQYGRQYHQMLYTLINEIQMQPSEWHRSIFTPMAWTSFIDRCYMAYLEGRKAEVQIQLQQGKAESPEDNQLQQDTAWLWARDKLTDLIKSCSRGSPTSQGNSVCALIGLVVATNKYAATLDKDLVKVAIEEAPEHMSQTHWTNMAINTVLAIMDFNYQPTGRIFSMCQQRSEKDRTPASLLARSGAALAVSQLIPMLISTNSDLVYQILDILGDCLPGVTGSPLGQQEAGVVQFYFGLGMGGVLSALFEEKFLDISGMQGMLAVWKAVDRLEKSAFSDSDTRMGSVLSLGVCLSAMCKDGKPDTKVRISRVQAQLENLTAQLDKENTIYEAACVSLACVTASAYAANTLSQDIVDRTVAGIYTSHIEQPHLQGCALALGIVCSGLESAGHPAVKDLLDKLFYTWLTQIQDENVLMMNKIAALHGINAISGADSCILQISSSGNKKSSIQTSDLMKMIKDVFEKSADIGLQSTAPWLMGQYYLSSFNIMDSKSSVPASYHYLPESSVLRACADLLIEACKVGPEVLHPDYVRPVLEALNEGPKHALPPLNWPAILSPLMRMSFGGDVEELCLSLAVKQSLSSPSAAMFITTWILSPLYDSLQKSSKLHIHKSLPTLIRVVPPAKLEEYLNQSFLGCFRDESINLTWCNTAINKGLLIALQVNDPPQSVTMLLYDTIDNLYQAIAVRNHEILVLSVCKCLQQIPDNQVDKITHNDFAEKSQPELSLHGLFVRCYLVGLGCQPLAWLNETIECVIHMDKSQQDEALSQLFTCFMSTDLCTSEVCHMSSKTQWLLELMGHIKNIAYGRITLDIKDEKMFQVLTFLLRVFASAVLSWCSQQTKYLLSNPSCSLNDLLDNGEDLVEDKQDNALKVEYMGEFVEQALPASLCHLLSVEPWKQLTTKIIDWLKAMYDVEIFKGRARSQNLLKGCLYSLRHSKEFVKINTWSRVYCPE